MPTLHALYCYPIKSCAGIALDRAQLLDTGLAYDRNWLLVDAEGTMLTQRTHPRMALIRTFLDTETLRVEAPGMSPLHTPLDASTLPPIEISATVWSDTMLALDTGADSARWFSAFFGMPVRLLRFAPTARRVVDPDYTGVHVAHTQFADGYPLLVIGQASLDDLNARLARKGVPPVAMLRFRPNLVIDGMEAYEEDYLESIVIEAGHASVELRPVKPCSRCTIPSLDPDTGAPHPLWPDEPQITLETYRTSARFGGAVIFGNNAIVTEGAPAWLEIGQKAETTLSFEE